MAPYPATAALRQAPADRLLISPFPNPSPTGHAPVADCCYSREAALSAREQHRSGSAKALEDLEKQITAKGGVEAVGDAGSRCWSLRNPDIGVH